MAALAVLSLLIVETPLMLLERGQYGRIMAALEALYGKQVDYKKEESLNTPCVKICSTIT